MAKAVIPRMQGDDYQARFFWLQACRLFEEHSKVLRVGYELDRIRFFDDVAVFYGTPVPDERGGQVFADYFQIKFHVDQAGAFGWRALTEPDFVGAESLSLLQRLHSVQKEMAPNGEGCRFHVVAPWPVHPDDELARLVSNQGGELRLDVLAEGRTERSAMGRVRAGWREHLGLLSDAELVRVLRPLRIHAESGHLQSVQDRLDDRLRLVGLRPAEGQGRASTYDDLIRKVRATGQSEFTHEQLREICRREGLCSDTQGPIQRAVPIGVRSFLRWTEYMEDETKCLLCLVRYFDNRSIRAANLWQESVFPELAAFLTERMREPHLYHLHLDVHTSIAFAAGYCLHPKSGVNVVPIQKTYGGRVPWKPYCTERGSHLDTWSIDEIERNPDGTDVAVAISATHNIIDDVEIFVNTRLSEVSRIISLRMCPEPSSTAVQDGPHAMSLAQAAASAVKKRSARERTGRLHIFAAAPNALVFFLGQLSHGLGSCVLYEYDFESNTPGAYHASLIFPA